MSWEDYERTFDPNQPTGWEHPAFNCIKNLVEEEINFLSESIHVEEGLKCQKCGSSKTYTYQKQVRSADEGTTSFTICFSCEHQTIE